MVLKTEKMLAMVAQQSHAATWVKANEMLKAKERELTLAIQEKDLRIKELELESKQNQPHDAVPPRVCTLGSIRYSLHSRHGITKQRHTTLNKYLRKRFRISTRVY